MKLLCTILFVLTVAVAGAQDINTIINAAEVQRIEGVLASDSLRGRKVFTPDIEKAADFIRSEFKKAGLKQLKGLKGYRQNFVMVKPTLLSVTATADGQPLADSDVVVVTPKQALSVTETSGFDVKTAGPKDNFFSILIAALQGDKNTVVFADPTFRPYLKRVARFARQISPSSPDVVFAIASSTPKQYSFMVKQSVEKLPLTNIVGVLPGKTRPKEYVIFSGHYDHLGVGNPVKGDSIYNGANDDAAGTTAVILLAKYFAALHNNARTLIFAAFTAEEIGEHGSEYFSKQMNPAQVMAMFNIEMIGTESKWGKNSAYITGYEKTDMGKIMQENLQGSGFTFYPDPYTTQNLFLRSDNATLARVGVPAHTISTSKMDNEPNYHEVSDEISTLDIANMTEIIKSVAIASRSIVSGKDTPTRVKPE